MIEWGEAAAHFAGTFVSEDIACISAGLRIQDGRLLWLTGVSACLLGIFISDIGLWLAGMFMGERLLALEWVRRRLPAQGADRLARWYERHGWKAIIAARFLPGARLPIYLAAGVVDRRFGRFAGWTLLAAAAWTPLIISAVAWVGPGIVAPLRSVLGSAGLATIAALLLLWLSLRIVGLFTTPRGRVRAWVALSRIWRWEFWPAWLFYLPLLPWIGWLSIRYRGFMTPTAANPGICPHGGVVGESKFAILSELPAESIVPSVLIPAGSAEERAGHLLSVMDKNGWKFPLILKPDAGQRGAGVRLIRDAESATRYFSAHSQSVIAQTYQPGPFEAGIFYHRMPDESRGRIFSITDKQFPFVVGDDLSTVETLIWRHPRLRMQARTFLQRLGAEAAAATPDRGEQVRLAIAGNHCQGTLFRDGSHLITPALEQAVDEIARRFEGFFFGRFDVRYADPDELRAGRGFAILELNGVTSESTNLYDPSWSLLQAYRILFRQWELLFEIGDRNRRLGHRTSSLRKVIADAVRFYRNRQDCLLSD